MQPLTDCLGACAKEARRSPNLVTSGNVALPGMSRRQWCCTSHVVYGFRSGVSTVSEVIRAG